MLSEERQKQLETIGMKWNSVKERIWNQYFEQAKEYYRKNGNLNVNIKYETESGLKLGVWISSQRCAYRNNKLPNERITLLESIGMSWQRDISRWEEGYLHAEEYYKNNLNLDPKAEYLSEDGFPLGRWIASQRNKYQKGKLSNERIAELEKIGMIWEKNEAKWQENYNCALLYFKQNQNLNIKQDYVTKDGVKLGSWVATQRKYYKKGVLDAEKQIQLENIGAVFQ